MTNNQLTPESVTRFTQYGVDMMEWPDGAYVKYEDYAALVEELQERRKADSEPVGWTDEEELRDVNVAGIGYLFGIDREANKFADPRRQIMLYRHPQPTVSEPWGYTSGILNPAVGMACVTPTRGKNQFPVYIDPQPAPVVPDEVEHVAAVLELIGSFEAADIDSDTVDLRFEIDDVDTGSDASITEYAARGAAIIRMLAGNSSVIPDGYVMVPKEPTAEMVKKIRYHVGGYDRNIKDGYKAMLAAAPQGDE